MGKGASVVVVVVVALLSGVEGVWLNLPARGTKCVSEEIQANVVVLADYTVIYDDHTTGVPTISVKENLFCKSCSTVDYLESKPAMGQLLLRISANQRPPYTRKRKNILACKNLWERPHHGHLRDLSGIAKRLANSNCNSLALATITMSNNGSENNSNGEEHDEIHHL